MSGASRRMCAHTKNRDSRRRSGGGGTDGSRRRGEPDSIVQSTRHGLRSSERVRGGEQGCLAVGGGTLTTSERACVRSVLVHKQRHSQRRVSQGARQEAKRRHLTISRFVPLVVSRKYRATRRHVRMHIQCVHMHTCTDTSLAERNDAARQQGTLQSKRSFLTP